MSKGFEALFSIVVPRNIPCSSMWMHLKTAKYLTNEDLVIGLFVCKVAFVMYRMLT